MIIVLYKLDSSVISIFPLDSKPYGLTYQQWAVKWWQWLVSIPKANNPALDHVGKSVNVNQTNNDVLFLCQTIEGVPQPPIRKSTIHADRAIFMPVMNWISIIGLNGETDQELISIAQSKMDVVEDLKLEINGVKLKENLKEQRAVTPFFNITLPEDNIFNLPAGQRRAVSDGYWVLFRSLPENVKIYSFGSCTSGRTKIGVNYDLIIA